MSISQQATNRSRQSRLKRRRSNRGEPLGSPRFTIFVTNRLTIFRIASGPMLSRRVGSLKCICPKNLHFPPSICLRTDNRNPPNSIARRSERRTRTRALRCAKSAEPCATTWPVLSATLNFPCLIGSLVGSKTAPCVLLGTKAVTCA